MALRALCLCDGYGGFELGLKLALGDDGVSTVARVERDSYAAATLVARMEESRLDRAPVWDDLSTFAGAAWRGCVDIVTAGFPCQPFSAAGQRRGTDDERWLWPTIARIVTDVGPSVVFLENVPGLNRRQDGGGLAHVLADLADLGFDAEWGLLSASDVGAPHRRQRFWLVAHANDDRGQRDAVGCAIGRTEAPRTIPHVGHACGTRRPEVTRGAHGDEGSDAGWSSAGGDIADGASQDVSDTAHARQQGRRLASEELGRIATGCGDVADTSGARRDQRRRQAIESPAVGRRGATECGFPPRPDDHDGWAEWIAQGGPEPSVRRSTDGRRVGLADALHLGGNGLVPAAAAHAFLQLTARLPSPVLAL